MKKIFQKIMITMFAFIVCMGMFQGQLLYATAAEKVAINKTSATIEVKKSVNLKITGTTSKVTWKSSNKKIATVNRSGKIVGVKEGKATITATVEKKKFTCNITVKKKSAYKTYKNKDAGISYSYPTTLKYEDTSQGMSIGDLAEFTPVKKLKYNPIISMGYTYWIFDVESEDFATYVEGLASAASDNGEYSDFSYKKIEHKTADIAYKAEYTYSYEGEIYHHKYVYLINDKGSYSFVYNCLDEYFDTYEKSFDYMVNSVKFY